MARFFLRLSLAIICLAALAAGCRQDDEPTAQPATTARPPTPTIVDSAACGEPVPEELDPNSGRHLLPGQPEPTFLTDPPTSGPHKPGNPPTGVLADPIPKAVQVGMLEIGQVIVQYKDLDKAGFDVLAALATETVTVAPNPSLSAPVIATAWQVKLTCQRLDEAALRAFITSFLKPEEAH